MADVRILTVATLAAVVLTGCSSTQGSRISATQDVPPTATAHVTSTAVPPTSVAPPILPPVPVPVTPGTCPYLSSATVADLNGQLVAGVRLNTSYDPPACFFLIGNGSVQLSVWVYRAGSPALATAAVDRAAAVATSDPASAPEGWIGGRSGGQHGAVYAVSKGAVAVVVTSNQEQSLKPQRVTEAVISSLRL
ncbi:MAG: DUF2020 domain-containing protein [Mycobacteriaceae bacterium]